MGQPPYGAMRPAAAPRTAACPTPSRRPRREGLRHAKRVAPGRAWGPWCKVGVHRDRRRPTRAPHRGPRIEPGVTVEERTAAWGGLRGQAAALVRCESTAVAGVPNGGLLRKPPYERSELLLTTLRLPKGDL